MTVGKIVRIFLLAAWLIVCLTPGGESGPVGTVFTYQGRLTDANIAPTSEYDFEFGLYDSPEGDGQLGGPIQLNELELVDGYFTVELDFGDVFDGNARWLEIGVRPGALGSGEPYTILSPRQQVTATPYALYALSGNQGPTGPQGPQGEHGPAYTGISPVAVDNTQDTIGLNAATDAGDLMTWDGNNWIAEPPEVRDFNLDNMQPYGVVNFIIALQGIYPSRNSAEPFLAEIIMFGGNFAPRGWAFCDGQLLSISQNSALFSLLGTTYGGDGRTTFALPDLRGRVPVHAGTGPGLSNRRIGQEGGEERIIFSR